MKNLIPLVILCFLTVGSKAQEDINYPSSRYSSIDSIVHHLYKTISGEKDVKRDWNFFRSLFRKDAKLIPAQMGGDGILTARYMTIDDYINEAGNFLETMGFHEIEIARTSEQFGNICHLFSTYESYKSIKDEYPFARGINSIQLLFDNNRWWIVNIYWQGESSSNPIPDHYLPNK